MSMPKAPAEDPTVVQQRKDEAARAERDRVKAIQEQLQSETELHSGNFGIRSLLSGRGGFQGFQSAPSLLSSLLGSR